MTLPTLPYSLPYPLLGGCNTLCRTPYIPPACPCILPASCLPHTPYTLRALFEGGRERFKA